MMLQDNKGLYNEKLTEKELTLMLLGANLVIAEWYQKALKND